MSWRDDDQEARRAAAADRYHADEIHRLLNAGTAVPADELPESEPSLRARSVLLSVIRDYFDGDPAAVVRFLRTS